jgi:O-acetyl-ADP-ribose deacetylase (regulator of RNase III)
MSLKIVQGDILESDAKYIVHQCNCVSASAGGLAGFLFEKYPYSDIYQERIQSNTIHKPGDLYIRGNGKDQRYVINAMAQVGPGEPRPNRKIKDFWHYIPDSAQARETYFSRCLQKIALIDNLETVAFPWKIGCGLAAGDWNRYLAVLEHFATTLSRRKLNQAQVILIKRTQDS